MKEWIDTIPGLGVRAKNALYYSHLQTLGELVRLSPRELRKLPRVGERIAAQIEAGILKMKVEEPVAMSLPPEAIEAAALAIAKHEGWPASKVAMDSYRAAVAVALEDAMPHIRPAVLGEAIVKLESEVIKDVEALRAERDRLQAQVLEYAGALAASRRESDDRLSRIQELTFAQPQRDEFELLRRLYQRCKEDRKRSPTRREMRALRLWMERMSFVGRPGAQGDASTSGAKEGGRG